MVGNRGQATLRRRPARRVFGAAEASSSRAAELVRFWVLFALTWSGAYGLGIWSAIVLARRAIHPLFGD